MININKQSFFTALLWLLIAHILKKQKRCLLLRTDPADVVPAYRRCAYSTERVLDEGLGEVLVVAVDAVVLTAARNVLAVRSQPDKVLLVLVALVRLRAESCIQPSGASHTKRTHNNISYSSGASQTKLTQNNISYSSGVSHTKLTQNSTSYSNNTSHTQHSKTNHPLAACED
jgi:hypothetical protein